MATTFDDALRMVRNAERASLRPRPLEDQAIINALKLHAYQSLNMLIERALDALDQLTGDPDLEDATGIEDSFEGHGERLSDQAPGCPIADPAEESDHREDDDPREQDDHGAVALRD